MEGAVDLLDALEVGRNTAYAFNCTGVGLTSVMPSNSDASLGAPGYFPDNRGGTTMSNFRGAIAIGSLLFTSSAMSVPVGPIEEIQLPAMLSFDYAAGMLGLVYGVDASAPDISATGSVTSSGFDWAVAGATYQGLSLDWSAAGMYDSLAHSIHWTGDGTYDGKTWTMTGDVYWLSGTEFRARHAISIAGVASAFTGVNGVPTWDSGSALDPPSKITYEIEKSDTWLLGIIPIVVGQKVDKVKISVEGGGIIEDTLEITDAVTKAGVDVVGRSGNIQLGGGTLKKTVKIVPHIPEPSTWTLLAAGLVGVACSAWRRRRHAGLTRI